MPLFFYLFGVAVSSVIDICNLALSRLGDTASVTSINPPEGSAQAEHCAHFYPIARDSMLEMYPWNFATRRIKLAGLMQPERGDWMFAYAAPANVLRILNVCAGGQAIDKKNEFVIEADATGQAVIWSNVPEAYASYTVRIDNSEAFPPLFTSALAWLLASELAGPLIKGDVGAAMGKTCLNWFAQIFSMAKISDAKQRHVQPENAAPWISGR